MSTADRNKVAIGLVILRLRETEAQLVLAQVRILKLERALEFYAAKTNWAWDGWGQQVLQNAAVPGWAVAETALHEKTEGE
jgi:hypothetical protein